MRLFLSFIMLFGVMFYAEAQESAIVDFSAFEVFDISTKKDPFTGLWTARGQMKNNSGKDYKMAQIQLSFFDDEKKLVGIVSGITIQNFRNGEEIVFIEGTQDDLSKWSSYKIRVTVHIYSTHISESA